MFSLRGRLLSITYFAVNVWENHLNYCMCPPRISESDVVARGSIGNFFFYTRFFYLSINLYTSYGVYSAPTRIYRRGAKSRIRINAYMKSKLLNAIRNTFRQPTTSVVKRKWLYQFWCLWLIVCSSVSVYSSILTFTDLYGKIPS